MKYGKFIATIAVALLMAAGIAWAESHGGFASPMSPGTHLTSDTTGDNNPVNQIDVGAGGYEITIMQGTGNTTLYWDPELQLYTNPPSNDIELITFVCDDDGMRHFSLWNYGSTPPGESDGNVLPSGF